MDAVDRRDVDDGAAAALALDLRRERLGHVEHAVHVDAHDAIDDVGIDVGDRHDRIDARVVDQHVRRHRTLARRSATTSSADLELEMSA